MKNLNRANLAACVLFFGFLSTAEARLCDIDRISQLASDAITDLRGQQRGGRPNLVNVTLKLTEIQREADTCRDGREPEPPRHRPRPGPGGYGRTCVMSNSGNGFSFLKDGSNFDTDQYFSVNNGAVLRIVSYEPVYYKGQARDGVQVEVVSNPGRRAGSDAQPGQRLWEYKSILEGDCPQ